MLFFLLAILPLSFTQHSKPKPTPEPSDSEPEQVCFRHIYKLNKSYIQVQIREIQVQTGAIPDAGTDGQVP